MQVLIQKALLLNKVAKHQAVEHQRSVPLLVVVLFSDNVIVNSLNKVQKSGVLSLKLGVEFFGDFLSVFGEVVRHPLLYVYQKNFLFFIEREEQVF